MIDITLHKRYSSRLRNDFNLEVNFKIHPEKRVLAIMGASGSGKTSILKMIAGLTQPDQGRIMVNDNIWYDSDLKTNVDTKHRKIGFVFQDYALFPHMTVMQNLSFASENHTLIKDLMSMTGVIELAGSYPLQLSGGQKQRVALIRAIVRQPELLLLDEPLSALDSRTRSRLQSNLKDILTEFDIPTILVTHDLQDAEVIADDIKELSEGKMMIP